MALEIPRSFHRIWIGGADMPEDFVAWGESWLELNPGWTMRTWTEDDLPELLDEPDAREAFERGRHFSEKSDLLRYELVWRHGGIYVDTDFECLKPIEALLDGVTAFAAAMKGEQVNTAIFGAVPGHPALERLRLEVRPRVGVGHTKHATATHFFTSVVTAFPDVRIFPGELFYPPPEGDLSEAYGVHRAQLSWKPHERMRRRIEELEKHLASSERKRHKAEERLAAAERRLAEREGSPIGRARATAAGLVRLGRRRSS